MPGIRRQDMDFPSFDLRLMSSFCVAAEELHLGRAAARLGVSRRGMTAQLGELERQLGVALFVRGDRSMSLSPAGERFVIEARAALDRAEQVAATFGGSGTGLRVHLGVATNPVVRAVVAAFMVEYPQLDVQVSEGSGNDSVRAVESGEADVGFEIADGVPGGLEFLSLDRQPLGVVVPLNHPIAATAIAPWTALNGARVLMAPSGIADSYNLLVRGALRRAGVRVAELAGPPVPRLSYVAPVVAAGRGLLVSSRHAVVPVPDDVAWIELTPTLDLEIGLLWRHPAGAPTRRFVELARSLSRSTPFPSEES